MLRVTNATFVWSDTHFGHRNIVKFQSRPASHEHIMLSEWARRVPEDADILHLGDVWMKGSNARWAAVLGRMPGRKWLILGNHDHAGLDFYERAGFTVIDPFVTPSGLAFTHRPITPRFPGHPEDDPLGARTAPLDPATWHTNVHGHIHGNPIHRNHHFGDGDPLDGKKYLNVSVETTDLAPLQLGAVLPRAVTIRAPIGGTSR